MPDSYGMVLVTTGNPEEANKLAEMLVRNQLAACVQISSISSCYMWNGQVFPL